MGPSRGANPDDDAQHQTQLPSVANASHPRIERLPQSVINRIAAGEVVIRPAAALKELLENSLDAGATSINVNVRDGGLRQMRIEDDGHGISVDNLSLLCQRFATSKLRNYEDLADGNVSTFGFRGEALASIAHVSRLSVVTRLIDDPVAYSANYTDSGQLLREPKPCARGKHGTTIIIDDLFYNVPTRRAAMQSPSDEYRAIVDVVTRYSIQYPHVAFSCKKLSGKGSSNSVADVCTMKEATCLQNIRAAFGAVVAGQTTEFEVDMKEIDAKIKAVVSTSNFSMRRGVYIFFINGRLVDCHTIKRAIASAYAPFLPKSSQPFVYVDLNMPAKDIDVNVHPMKKEVRFLNEDIIVEVLISQLSNRLKSSETSRTFLTQTVLIPKPNTLSLSQSHLQPEDMLDAANVSNINSENNVDDKHMKTRSSKFSDAELPQVTTPQREKRGGDIKLVGVEENDNGDDGVPLQMGQYENRNQPLAHDNLHVKDADVDADYIVDDVDDGNEHGDGGSLNDEEITDRSHQKKRARLAQTQLVDNLQTQKSSSQGSPAVSREYAKDKVRTSGNRAVGLLDKYVTVVGSGSGSGSGSDDKSRQGSTMKMVKSGRKPRRLKRRACAPPLLTSVEELLSNMQSAADRRMMEAFRNHSFVGVVSREFALIQYETELLLAEIEPLVEQLAYETLLRRFADHAEVAELTPGAPVQRVIDKHVKALRIASDGDADLVDSESCANLLRDKGAMLEEYFGLKFEQTDDENGGMLTVRTVPILFDRVMPHAQGIGNMLYELTTRTDWSEEAACFNGVARVIARWYASWWQPVPSSGTDVVVVDKKSARNGLKWDAKDREWVLRHVLFDSMRSEFFPPKSFSKLNVLREITSTAKLYKIFERC